MRRSLHRTQNTDSGSLFTGETKLQVDDAIEVDGEERTRRVTYVYGSERAGWRACFAGQGALPRGEVRWRLAHAPRQLSLRPKKRAAAPRVWPAMNLPRTIRSQAPLIVTGFDSAWTSTARGAIVSLLVDRRRVQMLAEPSVVDWHAARAHVDRVERMSPGARHLLVIDQPLLVPNAHRSRPVERALGAVLGRYGGGVQPANRSRAGMFGPKAPIWGFLASMSGNLDPCELHRGEPGRFVVEGFPALAILGIFPAISARGSLAKYNPTKASFSASDWRALCSSTGALFARLRVPSVSEWCERASERTPRKADQDQLDALVCAIVGLLWWAAPETVTIVGDLTRGYVLAPCSDPVHAELATAAAAHGVPVARGARGGKNEPPAAPRGSPAVIRAHLATPSGVSPDVVDQLLRAIVQGRKPKRFGPVLR